MWRYVEIWRDVERSIGKITSDIEWYHMHLESSLRPHMHLIYVKHAIFDYVTWCFMWAM